MQPDPLNSTQILNSVGSETLSFLKSIEIFDSINSTNQYLLDMQNAQSGTVCLAERQTAGRGRRGRQWESSSDQNIYLSLLWCFPKKNNLSGLSLAVGIAVAQALQDYGLPSIGLKWPNDLVFNHCKLGGILIESKNSSESYYSTVIGLGLNLYLPQNSNLNIQQPWTDLFSILGIMPARNTLIGIILKFLIQTLIQFQHHGFSLFYPAWKTWDVLYNQSLIIYTADQAIKGIGKGVDHQGYLLMEHQGEILSFSSAEITKTRIHT